jgi:hypothetical protein
MLKEVRDDNRENDAEHMRPVSTEPFHTRTRAEMHAESIDLCGLRLAMQSP